MRCLNYVGHQIGVHHGYYYSCAGGVLPGMMALNGADGAFSPFVESIAEPNVRSIKLGPAGAFNHLAVSLRRLAGILFEMQHCLYFLPDPQGQGSFLPTFSVIRPFFDCSYVSI